MFTLKNILLTLLFVVFIGILYKYFTKPVEPFTVAEFTKKFQGFSTIEKDKHAMDTYCFSTNKGVCRRRGALSNNKHARYLIGKSLNLNWPQKKDKTKTEYEIVAVITGNPYGTRPIGQQGKGADAFTTITGVAMMNAQMTALRLGISYTLNFAGGRKDITMNILSNTHSHVGSVLSAKGHADILLSDPIQKNIIKKLPKNTRLTRRIQGSFDKLKDVNDKINSLELEFKKTPTTAGKKEIDALKTTRLKNITAHQTNIKEAITYFKRPPTNLDNGGIWYKSSDKEQDFMDEFKKESKKTLTHESKLDKRQNKINKLKDGSRRKAWKQKSYDKKIRKTRIQHDKKASKDAKKLVKKTKYLASKKGLAATAKADKKAAKVALKATKLADKRAAKVAARAAARTAREATRAGRMVNNTLKIVKGVSDVAKIGGSVLKSVLFGPIGAVLGAALTIYDIWDAYKNDIKLMSSGDYCNRTKDRPAPKDVDIMDTLITEIRLKRKFPSIKQYIVTEGKKMAGFTEAEKISTYRKSIDDELKIANRDKFGARGPPKGKDPYKLGVIDENTRYTMYLNNFEQILNYLVPYKYLVDIKGNAIKNNRNLKVKNPNYIYLLKKQNRRHLDNVVHCAYNTLTMDYYDLGGKKDNVFQRTFSSDLEDGVDDWKNEVYSGKFSSFMEGDSDDDISNRKKARETLLQYMSQELLGVLAKNRVIYDRTDKVLRLLNESGVDDGRCYYHLYNDIDDETNRTTMTLRSPKIWCPEFTNLKNKDDVARTISLANLKAVTKNPVSDTWKNGRGEIIHYKDWKKISNSWGAPSTGDLYKPAKFSEYSTGNMYAPHAEKTDLIKNNDKFEYDKITDENLKNGWKKNKHRKILKYFHNPISVFMPTTIEYNHKVRKKIKTRLNIHNDKFFNGLTYLMPVQGGDHKSITISSEQSKFRWDVISDTFLKKPTRMSCSPYMTNVTKPNIDSEDPLLNKYKDGAGNNPTKAYSPNNSDYGDRLSTDMGRPKNTNESMWPQYYISKEGSGIYRCMKRDLDPKAKPSEQGPYYWRTGNPRKSRKQWGDVDEIISNAPLISSMYTYNLYTYTYKVEDGKFVSDEECVFGTDVKSRHNANGTRYQLEPEKLENANVSDKHINMVDIQLQIKDHLFDSYEKSSKEYDRIMTCKFTDKAKANKSTCVPKQRVKCAGFKNDKIGKEKISKQFDNFKEKKTKITAANYKETLNFLKCYRKVLNELDKTELKHLPNINEHDYLTQALIDYTISPSRTKDSKYCNEVKKQMSASGVSVSLNPVAVEAQAKKLSKVEGIKLRENLYNCTKEIGKDIDEIYN